MQFKIFHGPRSFSPQKKLFAQLYIINRRNNATMTRRHIIFSAEIRQKNCIIYVATFANRAILVRCQSHTFEKLFSVFSDCSHQKSSFSSSPSCFTHAILISHISNCKNISIKTATKKAFLCRKKLSI